MSTIPSVGGGFVVNDKTKGPSVADMPQPVIANSPTVDENLFYKAVDKSVVHGARLHQTHTVEKGDPIPMQPEANDPGHPPYPFESGNSLLALTKKHNVGSIGSALWIPPA